MVGRSAWCSVICSYHSWTSGKQAIDSQLYDDVRILVPWRVVALYSSVYMDRPVARIRARTMYA